MKKIIIISIVLLLFLGHTPYYDLNELAVVDTIGISYNDNKYNLYLNIVNEDNKTYKITGDSLGEIFLKGETINNKRTYYKHLSVIIFDTNVLNDNKHKKARKAIKELKMVELAQIMHGCMEDFEQKLFTVIDSERGQKVLNKVTKSIYDNIQLKLSNLLEKA